METLKINGKDYKVKLTWIGYKKLLAQQAPDGDGDTQVDKLGEMMIENIWQILVPRLFWIKPFIWKWRMERKITPHEVIEGFKKVTAMGQVEDREGGN